MRIREAKALTPAEWNEAAAVSEVRRQWALESGDDGAVLEHSAYAEKFDYAGSSVDQNCELFVLSDSACGGAPVVLVRNAHSRSLQVVSL